MSFNGTDGSASTVSDPRRISPVLANTFRANMKSVGRLTASIPMNLS